MSYKNSDFRQKWEIRLVHRRGNLMETLTMAIPESLMKDNFSIPVDNSPKKAEENGYVQDKPSFTSSSTKNTSGITTLSSDKSLRDACFLYSETC